MLGGRVIFGAEVPELRLVPLTITFEVHDSVTGKGIDGPEARQPDDVRVGKGSAFIQTELFQKDFSQRVLLHILTARDGRIKADHLERVFDCLILAFLAHRVDGALHHSDRFLAMTFCNDGF